MCYIILFYIVLALINTTQSRRYDVEQEAGKLYGTNLKSVLERFRRTPEYLKILNDRLEDLYVTMEVIKDRVLYAYSLKLFNKVVSEMGGNDTDSKSLRTRYHPKLEKHIKDPRKISRQGKRKGASNMLDHYKKFRSPLTLEETNRMKDLGFEYMGLAIHAMMEHMAPDGTLTMSTLLPFGGNQEDKTTVINLHQHEITRETTSTEPTSELTYQTFHYHTSTPPQRNYRLPNYIKSQ